MNDSRVGWRRVRFGKMVTSAGATRKARGWKPGDTGVTRYVGLEHLDSNSLKISRWGSPDDVGVNSDLRHFEPGDVILARRGIELRKVGLAEFRGVASGHALVFRARPEVILPELLPFFIQSDAFMTRADRFSVGSLSRTVNLSALTREEFALPSQEEQHRMLKIFRAMQSTIDATREVAAQAPVLLQSFIDEQISAAFQNGKAVSLTDLVEPGRPVTYGILKPGTGFLGGVPVIKVRDFPAGEILDGHLLLTDPKIDEEYRRSRLRAGDLLISIRGTVGRLAFVPPSLEGANITQDTARLSIREDVNPGFVRAVLESSMLKSQIRARVTGLAVKGLNIGELRRLQVPHVGRAEQSRIADAVDRVRAAARAASVRVQENGALQDRLSRTLWGAEA